jgi:hypothetical protein
MIMTNWIRSVLLTISSKSFYSSYVKIMIVIRFDVADLLQQPSTQPTTKVSRRQMWPQSFVYWARRPSKGKLGPYSISSPPSKWTPKLCLGVRPNKCSPVRARFGPRFSVGSKNLCANPQSTGPPKRFALCPCIGCPRPSLHRHCHHRLPLPPTALSELDITDIMERRRHYCISFFRII